MSPATVYLAVGWIAGWMVHDKVQLPPTAPQRADMLVIVTETAVLISLFAVGLRLRTPLTLKGWRVAAILASTGMLATIALATLAGFWLMPSLGWAGALLLAGILAPTDPVLASEVRIRSESDRDGRAAGARPAGHRQPGRVRHALDVARPRLAHRRRRVAGLGLRPRPRVRRALAAAARARAGLGRTAVPGHHHGRLRAVAAHRHIVVPVRLRRRAGPVPPVAADFPRPAATAASGWWRWRWC
jgi:hypothetical protein